jgi:non-specific serine/threonine protein kinase
MQLSRFKSEARAASALNHPNILTVHEIGAEGNRHFIAAEFIEGVTLRAWLTRGKINLRDALEIAVQAASGLAAAHEAGVVHRDIKPENIMLRPDGYVKVLDFGIAKLTEQPRKDSGPIHGDAGKTAVHQTRPGLVLGTARYMSPEQLRGEKADARSDIWSLGVVIYEMVAGTPPFQGETASDCIASILTTEPPPLLGILPNVPLKLEAIVTKALRKNRDARYQATKEMLADLRGLKAELDVDGSPSQIQVRAESIVSKIKRHKRAALLTLAATALVLGLSALFVFHRPQTHPPVAGSVSNLTPPEKSIAVLPFENLSEEKANAFFADGVQDEILTDLSRIADLKVISRTSVMQYQSGAKRNLRQIAKELGVAHVVEGSVQRAGDRVRINAQLIDARNDAHLWGQTYDRHLADVFAIQSEIAKAIADQLQARLSPNEKSAIEQTPTADLSAFDLYSRAKNLLETIFFSDAKANLLQAVELLDQAVARDPRFFDAYCQLAYAHDTSYFAGYDHTPARLALAEAAIQAAFRLRPDAGEAHLARAWNLYRGYLDYDGALAESEVARQSLPNDARIFRLMGFVQRRQGRWGESTRNLERAIDLDPRNVDAQIQTSLNYAYLRRHSDQQAVLDRALAIVPNDAATKAERALVELNWHADTRPLHQVIDSIQATNPGAMSKIANSWIICALSERNANAARNALGVLGENRPGPGGAENVPMSRLFLEGVIARMIKDEDKARSAFTAAHAEQEKTVQAQPNYAPALCVLGLIDAGLGRKEEALREGRRAVELLPVDKDAINGLAMIKYLAVIAAWVGDKDLACEQLAMTIHRPGPLSYGQLKLMPFWDPLRGEPRFEKIVEESKQPVALKEK